MAKSDALTELQTAFNCPADWDAMYGDDQVRRCSLCQRSVYNISEMTREEAIEFLESRGVKVCVRYFKRRDGTILTKPCGRMKKAVHKVRIRAASALAAVTFFGVPIFMPVYAGQRALTPKQQFRLYTRKLSVLRVQIAETGDKDEKDALQAQMREYRFRVSEAYRKMSAEDIEALSNEKASEPGP